MLTVLFQNQLGSFLFSVYLSCTWLLSLFLVGCFQTAIRLALNTNPAIMVTMMGHTSGWKRIDIEVEKQVDICVELT